MSTDKKFVRRTKIRYRIRKKAWGTAERPRLAVFRSNKEIYAQIIDDLSGHTLASASSRDAAIAGTKGPKVDVSKLVGEALAEKAKAAGISAVIFDRGGYLYHGRVKALAEGAREKGLNF